MQEMFHLEDHGAGRATAFYRSGRWKRLPAGPHSTAIWIDEDGIPEVRDSEIWDLLERGYRHQETTMPIRRRPRRNAEDVARFRTARLMAALEKRAHNWIGRGLKANTKLGRIFIRLKDLVKDLVGHGHFEAYYQRTFGKCGISFRTAQEYMRLAREAGKDTNCADSALFPLAMDRQAAEIRSATKAHQLAVAAAQSDGSAEASSADEHRSSHAEESSDSTCICRPSLHVTPDQKAKITELWRSEHRASAEIKLIDLLMKLCDRYEGSGDSNSSSEENDD